MPTNATADYLYETAYACVLSGEHLTDCDNDGYCNLCGEHDAAEGITRLQALALAPGTIVLDLHDGCIGEVGDTHLFGELTVVWRWNVKYSKRLGDYIASTTWDLLDPDHYETPVALEVLP